MVKTPVDINNVNNINNIKYGVCINWGNNSVTGTKKTDIFESVDFSGFVNPTIELWRLADSSSSNFIKLWMHQDSKYSEEE